MEPTRFDRRHFLRSAALGTLLAAKSVSTAAARSYKAAVIGRTGGGDYGHGFDTIFAGLENISLEAIADADAKGLELAVARTGARRKYLDYREMLQQERPQLVSIAPRQPDCHKPMALAAIEVGAHIVMEKPFTEHLEDADEIIRAAKAKNIQIVVGHKNRYSPHFVSMKQHLDAGFFGQVLEMRVVGKQDQRAGGEDLIVLGTHDFDTMRFFFGNPLSCSASVTVQGRGITKSDVKKGREPMLVAGDTIHAAFQFARNVQASWHSVTAAGDWNVPPRNAERWGFHIFGTKRVLAYYSGSQPLYWDSPFLGHSSITSDWKPLPPPPQRRPDHQANLVADLVHAIETNTSPLCSGEDGRWTIEMVASVYESQRQGRAVTFPLAERANPLLRL